MDGVCPGALPIGYNASSSSVIARGSGVAKEARADGGAAQPGRAGLPQGDPRLDGVEHLVSPVAIADRLRVRAPSVTGMLKRLADAGWIEYEPGCGARLTPRGRRRGAARHPPAPPGRAVPDAVLGLDWSEVDAEAEALEHAISPRLEQAIAAHLGEPLEDPHGHPIPTPRGRSWPRATCSPLHRFRAGQQVLIREVRDDSPERLRRWQTSA